MPYINDITGDILKSRGTNNEEYGANLDPILEHKKRAEQLGCEACVDCRGHGTMQPLHCSRWNTLLELRQYKVCSYWEEVK